MIYGVEPDVAVFGKAIGNGFPISAIIGRKSVMDSAQATFISSTFWTERVGFVAALATIEKMQRCNVSEKLVAMGERINAGWMACADRHNIDIEVSGIAPLSHIHFKYPNHLAIQTFYTQEMLKLGFLVGAAVYSTYVYTNEIVDYFIKNSDKVFASIKKLLVSGGVESALEGPVRHSGFRRLN
jgi:glutamate-1-semialdehyde aminotransferase